MNSMIDPQNEVASLATVAPEEVYGGFNGPEDDAAEDARNWVDDEPQDDSPMYPDDGDYDASSDF